MNAPTIPVLDPLTATVVAENLREWARYHRAVQAKCTTEQAQLGEHERAKECESYAAGLLRAAGVRDVCWSLRIILGISKIADLPGAPR